MSKQLKAIILDVDGVIVGEKIGYNSPNPHLDVIKSLKNVQYSFIAPSVDENGILEVFRHFGLVNQ